MMERKSPTLGRVRWIQICRRLLRALRRHFCRRWLAGNTTRSKQLLLDVILGLAWQSIIKLARFTEYQHLPTPDFLLNFLLSPGEFNLVQETSMGVDGCQNRPIVF
jgi:hypothetical protein